MIAAAPSLRLHSIMLGARDIETSVAFYTEALGLPLRARFEDFALLDAGGAMLVLSGGLSRARPSASSHPVEVVLAVENVRDAYDRLRARGISFLGEPHSADGTNEVANFEDPDGHLLSLYGSP